MNRTPAALSFTPRTSRGRGSSVAFFSVCRFPAIVNVTVWHVPVACARGVFAKPLVRKSVAFLSRWRDFFGAIWRILRPSPVQSALKARRITPNSAEDYASDSVEIDNDRSLTSPDWIRDVQYLASPPRVGEYVIFRQATATGEEQLIWTVVELVAYHLPMRFVTVQVRRWDDDPPLINL